MQAAALALDQNVLVLPEYVQGRALSGAVYGAVSRVEDGLVTVSATPLGAPDEAFEVTYPAGQCPCTLVTADEVASGVRLRLRATVAALWTACGATAKSSGSTHSKAASRSARWTDK